jgi:hypothetical protein
MDEIILIKRNGKHLETRGTDQTTPDPITLVTLNQHSTVGLLFASKQNPGGSGGIGAGGAMEMHSGLLR